MLKIKDDVDLKELEKFGFKYRPDTYIQYLKNFQVMTVRLEPNLYGEYNKGLLIFYISVNNEGYYTDINLDEIMLEFQTYNRKMNEDLENINKLFNDLIQAGLVEKVDD